jgi:catechol 2,3-dioxygenase-like lactoylglutathione lyase family enzyme
MNMRLETLTLSTRDLLRARSFYAGQLGFPVVDDEEGQFFVVDAGGVRLHVDRSVVRSSRLENTEPRLVFHTGDLRTRCLELRDAGISVEGPLAQSGRIYAQLADPDGHPIVILEHRSN